MAIIFILLGFGAKRSNARLEADRVSYSGVITSAEIDKGPKGKKRYLVRVTWGEGDQTKTDNYFEVTPTFFESRIGEAGVASDPAVTVRASPRRVSVLES